MIFRTTTACLIAWLIPGGGYFFLSKWKRGVLCLSIILILFGLGLYLDGVLFGLTPGLFGILKFVAAVSMGLPYFIGKLAGLGLGDITSLGYEYGNTYLYTAGLLNMLLVVDTFDIARGRKR